MALPLDIATNASKIAHPPHPYYPLEVEITGYLANEWSVPALLGAFAGGCSVIFGLTYLIIKRVQPRMPAHEVFTVMWFVLSKSPCLRNQKAALLTMNFRRIHTSLLRRYVYLLASGSIRFLATSR